MFKSKMELSHIMMLDLICGDWMDQVFKLKLTTYFSGLESEIWNMHRLVFVFIIHT